jgi:hypothetical protein
VSLTRVRSIVRSPRGGQAWLVLMLGAAICVATLRPSAQPIATADELKAAFIFNFVKFVDWPSEAMPAGTPLVLGVFGSDGIDESLRAYARGKTINGRELTVRRISGGDDLSRLHLLFVGAAEQGRVGDVIKRVDGNNVLTVSDAERFCQSGGVIALAMEQNRVRFDVNLDAAERSRLRVSSKLLALARSVQSSRTGDR